MIVRALILLTFSAGIALSVVAAPPKEKKVSITMVALRATHEGHEEKVFGRGVEEVREALKDLDYDSYEVIAKKTATTAYNKEADLPINNLYQLKVTPLSEEEDARIRIKLRVEKQVPESGRTVNAALTTVACVPGDKLKLCGLPLDKGDLVIVISVRK